MTIKNFTIRIEENLLAKFHVVANAYQRSANKQMILTIKKNVQAYEAKFGEIELEDSKRTTKTK